MLKDCRNITQTYLDYGITPALVVLNGEAGFNAGLCWKNGALKQKLFESGNCLELATVDGNHVWYDEISNKCNSPATGI